MVVGRTVLEIISYTDMLSLWRRGHRNGAIRKLTPIKRALFSAALSYAKMKGMIINQKLIGIVKGVAEQLKTSIGQKIFARGLLRSSEILKNSKMMRIFPFMGKWINDDAYVFWLGTEFTVRSWIFV
jgi:hypothetical protein